MASPSADLENSPNPRTREENQERAFIAASRRKDRSLDARLESANRASVLHKQRTGKSLNINRDIVEKEAMYEEVDERYQEKLQKMISNQRYQVLQDEYRHNLFAAFAARTGGIQHRRASYNPRTSVNGGVHKMSLDLSNLRSSISEGMHPSPMTSPMTTNTDNYVLSPAYDPSAQTPSYSGAVPASSAAGQVPCYVTPAPQPTPSWPPQAMAPQPIRSPWPAFPAQDQQQMQIPWASDMNMNMPAQQFRDRMGSAPVLPVHGLPSSTSSSATPTRAVPQHTRVRSEPGQPMRASMQSLTSSMSSPQTDATTMVSSTEPLSTPDLCPTPSTPHSPTSTGGQQQAAMIGLEMPNKEEESGVSLSNGLFDQDYADFSQFSFTLGDTAPMPDGDFKFDELVALDEYPVAA